jgi:alcohol dehydrogenase class IV
MPSATMPPTFCVTTKVISGTGSLAVLPTEIDRLGGQRLAVVADEGVAHAGLLAQILCDVDPGRVAATVLIAPDPGVAAAEQAAEVARGARCDLVIAVGGGSALGAAKAVAIRLTNHRRIDEYQGVDQVPQVPAPAIAIPTTAGSGSEVSKVLVLHEPGRKDEVVVRVDGGEPNVAILDATVLRGLPRAPMLYAGLDALSHSLEPQWSRRGSWFTSLLGKSAARAIIASLPAAVAGVSSGANMSGANDATLQQLLEASCAANMACGNSGLALVHALSGAPSVHLAHGRQNGILLPHVARFNDAVSDGATRALVAELADLYRTLEFEAAYPASSTGSGAAAAMVLASTGHPFRVNNRRESADEELFGLLEEAGVPRSGHQ